MKANKTYIIRNKTTKEIWRAPSGKTSWKATGHAKNAWATQTSRHLHHLGVLHEVDQYGYISKGGKFDEQGVFEIVELRHKSEAKLEYYEELVDWLVDMIPNLDDMIEQFNESYGVSE